VEENMLASVLLVTACVASAGHTAEEWKTRTIYQVVTDRFARNNGDTTSCSDLTKYCGGGWRGLINNLDYIQGMGFDAIWVSPILKNSADNYHGYCAEDFYSLNDHFGSDQDFKDLVSTLHARGMWIMVDVVANHVAAMSPELENVSTINPFNQKEYYHSYCSINWDDPYSVENCWLGYLPDLDQDNSFVHDKLVSWINWLVTTYDIDGLRLDTCLEVPKNFWSEFTKSAGVYSVCEVFDGSVDKNAGYQGYVDATLNYPLYFSIRNTFMSGQSLYQIRNLYNQSRSTYRDIHLQGNFADNHDNARFLSQNGNIRRFQNALAMSLTFPGIPIVYYGGEQGYAGGNDPYNREILWTSLNTSSEMYKFVKTVVQYRKEMQIWNYDFVERYAADNFYAFSRGKALFAFSNSDNTQSYTVSYHPYNVGEVVCNVFYATDCVTVTSAGVPVVLVNGEVKLYKPKN
jgi:alpha-amylase